MTDRQLWPMHADGHWIVTRLSIILIKSEGSTASWSGVQYLYNFLINNRSVGPYGHVVSQNEAMPGDIVQLGTRAGHFYHSPVITAVTPAILVAAHTDDALDRPLSSYVYDVARFVHIDGVRTW